MSLSGKRVLIAESGSAIAETDDREENLEGTLFTELVGYHR